MNLCRKHGQSENNILRLWGEQVMQKNSVNKSVYFKGFLAMIRDNFDVAVATDIIGKSREIKARYSDRKERGMKSDYT